jgi:hypothetical protein
MRGRGSISAGVGFRATGRGIDCEFKAASLWAGAGEHDLSPQLARQRAADRQAQAKALATVALVIVQLIKLIEKVGGLFQGNANTGVVDL